MSSPDPDAVKAGDGEEVATRHEGFDEKLEEEAAVHIKGDDTTINDDEVEKVVAVMTQQEVEGTKPKAAGKKRKPAEEYPDVRMQRGLPYDVQRALAQAIESEGGIRWFAKFGSVKTLCDSNTELFGLTGSKRREQVRNRIFYWKKLPHDRYKVILERFGRKGVPMATASTQKVGKKPSTAQFNNGGAFQGVVPPGVDPMQSQELTRSAMVLQAQCQANAQIPGQAPQYPAGALQQLYQAAQLQQQQMPPANASQPGPPPAKKRKLSIDDGIDYETIHVDTKNPERNGGFEIFEVSDVEKGENLVNAFEITTSGDLRDFLADSYKAELVGTREVLLHMPSVSYSFLHDHEEFSKQAKGAGFHCPCTEDAHESARKRILKDPARQKRRILFVFPEDVELSNKVFSPESTNKEIEFDLNPITVPVNLNGKELPMTITRISWKVSVVEKQERRRQAPQDVEAQTKGAAKLAQLFSRDTSVGI